MIKTRGFSMIELAIALTIAGLVAAWGLGAWLQVLANQKLASARRAQESVHTALVGFIAKNNRLPCPAVETLPMTDANYGREATSPGTCTGTTPAGTSVRGLVPWITLGIPDETAQDPWYRRMTYYVTLTQTNLNSTNIGAMRGTMTLHSAAPFAMGLAPTGNQINSCSTTAIDNSCNMNAVAVIVTHGPNGLGAFLPSGARMTMPAAARESENADTDEAFIRADFSTVEPDPFDDFVLALSPDDLLRPLAEQGALQSPEGQTHAQIRIAIDRIINETVANNGAVPADGTLTLNDAWGNALRLNQQMTNVCGSPEGVAFQIRSLWIDQVEGNNAATGKNDDLSIDQRSETIRKILTTNGVPCPTS